MMGVESSTSMARTSLHTCIPQVRSFYQRWRSPSLHSVEITERTPIGPSICRALFFKNRTLRSTTESPERPAFSFLLDSASPWLRKCVRSRWLAQLTRVHHLYRHAVNRDISIYIYTEERADDSRHYIRQTDGTSLFPLLLHKYYKTAESVSSNGSNASSNTEATDTSPNSTGIVKEMRSEPWPQRRAAVCATEMNPARSVETIPTSMRFRTPWSM